MERKGVSPVIATVLLILITVLAAGLIVAFVIPFIGDVLGDPSKCFQQVNSIEIETSLEYTCTNSSFDGGRTSFSIGIDNEDITGVSVRLFTDSGANAYDIQDGAQHSIIRMLSSGDFSSPLKIPQSGGVRTYVAKGDFTMIEARPILEDGTICTDEVVSHEFNECTSPEVHADITST